MPLLTTVREAKPFSASQRLRKGSGEFSHLLWQLLKFCLIFLQPCFPYLKRALFSKIDVDKFNSILFSSIFLNAFFYKNIGFFFFLKAPSTLGYMYHLQLIISAKSEVA
jgi:hypothetical protein